MHFIGTRGLALVCVTACSIACGARSELAAPPPRPLCVSGDAPVLLRAWDEPGWVSAVATDGREVFVSESSAPSVWGVDAQGGAIVTFDNGNVLNGGIGARMFPWNGGLYFDTWRDDPFPLHWAADDGSAVAELAARSNAVAFDPSRRRAFDNGPFFLVDAVSLVDGARTGIVPGGGFVLGDIVTSARFLHAIAMAPDESVIDLRMDLASDVVAGVPLGYSFDHIVTAGDAMCFDDGSDVKCLADDGNEPVFVAKAAGVSSADASWVYVADTHHFSRISRVDGHAETLLEHQVVASVSDGACVFAVSANKNAMSLWRLAP